MRINHHLERSAERTPGKTALICGNRRWTYRELNDTAGHAARSLIDGGILPGDRVAIFLDNSFESVVSLYGALMAGAAFMILNPTMKAGKLTHILRDSGARALVTQANKLRLVSATLNRLPHLERLIYRPPAGGDATADLPLDMPVTITAWDAFVEPRQRPALPLLEREDDLAALIYTSGSTGEPKGVISTHANMSAAVESITTYLENRQDDIVLNVMPLSFDYGLYQVLMTVAFGGTLVLEKSFAYPFRIIERLIQERVTGFPIVPTIAAILLRMENLQRYDFSFLRYITNTAAALPVEHITRLQDLFPTAKIFSMYGLTECKRVSYLPPNRLRDKPASVGVPMPNTEVEIVDERGLPVASGAVGELVIRGPNVMQGYWNDPEETARVFRTGPNARERTLHSGDLFRMDEEGFLYFVGRKDDQLKSMGERVSPREIENLLCTMPAISEAAVIGVPDAIAGTAIKAYVVPAADANPTAAEIITYCRNHLEPFMIPKYIELVPGLPQTAHGKIDKQRLEKESGEKTDE